MPRTIKAFSFPIHRIPTAAVSIFATKLRAKSGKSEGFPVAVPFNHRPPISTYLSHAGDTGLISAYDAEHGALLNYNIDLEFPLEKGISNNGNLTLDLYPRWGLYEQLGVLATEKVSAADARSQRLRDFSELVIRKLRSGSIVGVYGNQFYFKGTSSYLTRDFRHPVTIIGAEGNGETVVAVGYSRKGLFEAFSMPMRLLFAGVKSSGDRVERRWDYNSGLNIVQYTKKCVPIDLGLISSHLQRFINSDAPGISQIGAKSVYGDAALCQVAEYLVRYYPLKSVDVRVTKLLAEYCGLMAKRADVVSKIVQLSNATVAAIRQSYTSAQKTHWACVGMQWGSTQVPSGRDFARMVQTQLDLTRLGMNKLLNDIEA